ncbi:MAG: non-ribosomal peptide synthetase [Granulosicoccus sp.]|nr:non-ribosomal peptide synthetase [Granulosicoccus sp.]
MIYKTLTEVLLDRADSERAIHFIEGQGQRTEVSYPQFLSRALDRLAHLQSAGMEPGSHLIIQTNDNAHFLEALWACLLGGITAVPVSGGNSAEHRFKLFRIASKFPRPGLFTNAANQGRLSEFAAKEGLQQAFSSLAERSVISDQPVPSATTAVVHDAQENDTAFIQFSSGSTSAPKGVVLTHRNLLTNLRDIVDGARMGPNDHQFSWMPLTHDMGLIGFHLNPVHMDNSHSLMPTDLFVRRPAAWLDEVAEIRATITCSPNFGYQHLLKSFKPERHRDLDLSCLRLIFNGAEPISVSLCRRFMQTLAPAGLATRSMYPVYGLAEASLAVTFPDLQEPFGSLVINRSTLGIGQSVEILDSRTGFAEPATEEGGDSADAGVEFVSVGRPVAHVDVRISDAAGNPLPDSVTGHIRIHGENVTSGYFEEDELNRTVISDDGWLDTGDLGFQHDGQLYITGRARDIIFVNGQNVFPHDLEEILLQAGLVERGKLAISSQRSVDAGEEQLLVFVLHRSDPSELLDAARAMTRLLSEAAGVSVHAVVPVSRIPKTTSGKVQRYLLVESLASGELTPLLQHPEHVADSTESDVSEAEHGASTEMQLLAICNAQVEAVRVTANDNLFDLGISSLTLAQIHAAIEDTWPEQVDITDLFDYPTVTELARFLDERNASGS